MKHISVLCCLAVASAVALPAAAEVIDKTFHETFEVDRGDRLYLEHGDGDVELTTWDQPVLDVQVVYHLKETKIGPGKKADFEVEFDQRDDLVRVIGKEEGGYAIGFLSHTQYRYEYTIKAPAWLALELTGDDGDVQIESWRADIDLELDDGDVTLGDIEADHLRLRLADGDFAGEDLRCDLQLELDDGDIRLSDCELGTCRITAEDGEVVVRRCSGAFEVEVEDGDVDLALTGSGRVVVNGEDGDVELDLHPAGELDIDIETEDGDITVALLAEADADFDIETGDGDIRIRGDADLTRDRENHRAGTVGRGGGRIDLRSDDGTVTLDLEK